MKNLHLLNFIDKVKTLAYTLFAGLLQYILRGTNLQGSQTKQN